MNGWDIWATIGAWVQATKSGESSRSGREHGRHMWRLLGTPCSSWSGRVQINQSAHPLNVQKLKVLRDSAISSDVLDSHVYTLDTKLNKHDYDTLVVLMTPLPKEEQSASCDTFSQIFSALSQIGRGCQQTEIRKGNP